MKKKKTLKRTK